MDSAAVVLGQSVTFSSATPSCRKELRGSSKMLAVRRRGPAIGILSSGFCDQGHLQYYNSKKLGASAPSAAVINGKEDNIVTMDRSPKKMKKKTKKQLKLLKELSRDLSTFSQMGFGLDGGDAGLAGQINRDKMTEATDLILERLQKIRAQEKEQKRKMKEEKAKLKASQMQMNCEMSSTSSSSSSESSDSECGEVVNIKNLKKSQANQKGLLKETDPPITPQPVDLIEQSNPVSCTKTGTLSEENVVSPIIEVCMGGKCKRSGGEMVLEELKKAVGIEGAVSSCKCMGKCKEGPNVKVLNGVGDNAVTSGNSLCIGVGVEDVEMIVANFLGQNNQIGFAGA